MFELLREILFGKSGDDRRFGSLEKNEDLKVQIATCALFLEIAKADGEISEQEMLKLVEIMKSTFEIEDEFIEELIELTKADLKKSVSIYEFTSKINETFTQEEKNKILVDLWRLIYVDESLDKYEDFMIKKIAGNLKFEHYQIIEAKLFVKEEMKKNRP
ncbi:MAG: TerB family tellurite resistance protein [Ignavibacteriales bacterium]|nr:MAG: TerB family tellurite resistance protein [Ignavibacteriales bacterium]